MSGPDGYEAFENTNNKKKRKIPTSGSLSMHHSALADDLSHLGINANSDGLADEVHGGQNGVSAPGLGVQGAGRGRYARKTSGRHPLGVSLNGINMKAGGSKYDQNMSATAKGTMDLVDVKYIANCFQLRTPKIKG